MNNDDNNLDLLDLDDNDTMDTLPEVPAFVAPRPKKPWLLLSLGLVIIILSSYIIIRSIGGDSSSSIEVDLDAPVAVVEEPKSVEMNVMPPVKVATEKVQTAPVDTTKTVTVEPKVENKPEPQFQARPQPVAAPVRVVQDRKEVKFEPAKTTKKPAVKTQQRAAQPQKVASVSSWYVQFGSYSTRALAEGAQARLQKAHAGLFAGKQFVILGAQLKNGATTYRLRVGFNSSADANGFCRNAKADGLDCYITK